MRQKLIYESICLTFFRFMTWLFWGTKEKGMRAGKGWGEGLLSTLVDDKRPLNNR